MRTLNLVILNTILVLFVYLVGESAIRFPGEEPLFYVGYALGAMGVLIAAVALLTGIVKLVQFFLSLKLV